MVVQMETVDRQLLNIIQTEFPMEPERSEEVGRIMAANPAVTHCYERPTFPDWPYTHFSMIHAATKDGCDRIRHGHYRLQSALQLPGIQKDPGQILRIERD